jgi:hypothetical protein
VLYSDFTTPGTYVCTFHVRNDAGEVSSPKQAEVIVPYIYEGGGAALATIFLVGGSEQHDFAAALDEVWVKFYASAGLVFNVEATQLGDNSDVRMDLYYGQPDDTLTFVGAADNCGRGAGFSEGLTVDLKTRTSGLVPGVYYVRVSSADTKLFGAGTEYELRIYVPSGTGGGVITITVGGGSGLLAHMQVPIGPAAAVAAGAAWRLQGTTAWSGGPTYTASLASGSSVTLEFKPIPGWNVPTNNTVRIALGQLTVVPATYTPAVLPVPPVLTFKPASGLGITGTAGATFRLEYRTSLVSGQWLPLKTNTLGPGFNLLLPWPPSNGPTAFYRAVWLP